MAASPSSEPAYGLYPYEPHEVNKDALRAWSPEQGVPDLGERLLGEIVASIEAMADHPQLDRIVPEESDREWRRAAVLTRPR